MVAAVKSKATVTTGCWGGLPVEFMLDSGSSVSLVRSDVVANAQDIVEVSEVRLLRLVTAAGDPLPIVGRVRAPVKLGELGLLHEFVVVENLIASVILGVDFLHGNSLVLDFTQSPVSVRRAEPIGVPGSDPNSAPVNLIRLIEAERKIQARACAIAALEEVDSDVVEDCAIPLYQNPPSVELPECPRASLRAVVEEHSELFRTVPGVTQAATHFIPTTGNPVRVPPRRVPAHYREEVEKQIAAMLEQGIIEESSSPWVAPAVFVPKKSGEIRICVDYRELNKKTVKDSYPLPLPDEVQDRLTGSTIFSTLDLHSGYWQVPVNPADQEKTAFCPGPGMGLYQFKRMPFGLTGAPSSFQRLMDKIMRGLPYVTTYIDDILVHSVDEETHVIHLAEVFRRLAEAGLTLRGRKCHIGMKRVTYLGHVFSGAGMNPDPKKVDKVREWPVPTNATEVRQFLGLASYYRRYIGHFAEIAAPLHSLTQKDARFNWNQKCMDAFVGLKQHLTQMPVLSFPRFDAGAVQFILQTDASAVGLGAVLEQDGHVIGYASRSLTSPERQYSVIQRECLAVVYALKQFRHYLLGRPFLLHTDHAPLQWLSAQKMEGMLCRWALAMQEYDFKIVYRKGVLNANADALSRVPASQCAVTLVTPQYSVSTLHTAQCDDSVVSKVLQARKQCDSRPVGKAWKQHPLRRYRQLWAQLKVVDDVLCREYTPSPLGDAVTVPVLPASLRHDALLHNHNAPTAGHQGIERTLDRLRQEAYWVGMARDVDRHCRECGVCQQSKLAMPQRAPLVNMPIGRPWQMVAVDILEVPLSRNNNRYLLVVQDYFTKWAEAIPLPDQTAVRITGELTKIFSQFGHPDVLHSDQGRNFESSILAQTLEAFGVRKSRTTAYHPQGDGMVERFNRSLLQLLRTYVDTQDDWECYLPLVLFAYRTSVHASTGASPFLLMFGRSPAPTTAFSDQPAFDAFSYPAHLQAKIAKFRDFVETNLAAAGYNQKHSYDGHTSTPSFSVGSPVWLSIPTAGKLDPRWEGKWVVKAVKNPVNIEIANGKTTKVVHTNRLRHRHMPTVHQTGHTERVIAQPSEQQVIGQWEAPNVNHWIVPPAPIVPRRYPQRHRAQPDRLAY